MNRARGPHHRGEPGRLPGWQRWAVYGSCALLLLSGALWLLFHFALQVDSEFGPRPHALQSVWLMAHGGAAMLALVALGSLLPTHVQRAWLARKNRRSGALLLAALALLIVTGYALYYLAGETSRGWVSALHWGLGLLGVPALAWHVGSGLRLRRRRRPAAHPSHPPPAELPAAGEIRIH